jgi:hypothetical protein
VSYCAGLHVHVQDLPQHVSASELSFKLGFESSGWQNIHMLHAGAIQLTCNNWFLGMLFSDSISTRLAQQVWRYHTLSAVACTKAAAVHAVKSTLDVAARLGHMGVARLSTVQDAGLLVANKLVLCQAGTWLPLTSHRLCRLRKTP